MEISVPARRVQRVRHETRLREVQVVRVERSSPHFVAVTFGGETLADFVSASFDDHVKFMFEGPGGGIVRRDYTPRRHDNAARELTIEFALHGDGPASDWARHASVGQRATVGGPRGSMIIPLDYDWHLLAGDATALPAIERRAEAYAAGTRAIAVVQIGHAADRREIRSAAALDLRWVATADELVATVRALPWPPGEGHVWCAGEASAMARLRQLLLEEKRHPKEALRVAAYWKHGASDFHETAGA